MKHELFNLLTRDKRLRRATLKALRLVMVDGRTWREASHATGVHESTILRARARIMPDDLGFTKNPEVLANRYDFIAVSLYEGQAKYPGEIGAIVEYTSPTRTKATIKQRIVC